MSPQLTIQSSIYRPLGLPVHLRWARLLIEHTNERIKYPDTQLINSTPGDDGDDEENEHEGAYFDPDSGCAASKVQFS